MTSSSLSINTLFDCSVNIIADQDPKSAILADGASRPGLIAGLTPDSSVWPRIGRCGGGLGSRAPPVPAGCNNRHMAERLEVQRAVAAPAGEIFAVLRDPRGHVAIDSSGMLMEASGDIVAKAGDTFVVHMDREALNDYPLGRYDVTVEIVTFEPGREIAWTVRGQLNLGHVYGYRLEPIDEGTLVTSYYDWSAAEQSWKDAAIFPVVPESALRATLGILARTVAPGKPRPALSTR